MIWLVLCRCSHGDGAGCHLSLADTQALPMGEPDSVATTAALQSHKKSRANSWKRSHKILIIAPSAQIHIVDGGHFALDTATEIATSR
jgi:hypothetical protein